MNIQKAIEKETEWILRELRKNATLVEIEGVNPEASFREENMRTATRLANLRMREGNWECPEVTEEVKAEKVAAEMTHDTEGGGTYGALEPIQKEG